MSRGKWPTYYILVGRTPMAVDLWTWTNSFQERHRNRDRDPWRVGLDVINDRCHVSTVFVGIDHNFSGRGPVLFETLIFGGPIDGEGRRYCTYDDAERGHAELLRKPASPAPGLTPSPTRSAQKKRNKNPSGSIE